MINRLSRWGVGPRLLLMAGGYACLVTRDDYDEWLDLSVQEPGRLERLLVPYPAEEMRVVSA